MIFFQQGENFLICGQRWVFNRSVCYPFVKWRRESEDIFYEPIGEKTRNNLEFPLASVARNILQVF